MQQKDRSALTPSQQIGLSICFGPQYLVLTAVALLTKLIQHDSLENPKSPTWFKIGLLVLVLVGLLGGVFLVVVAWTGLGKYTPDFWADIELSFTLLWSMLLEVSTNLTKFIIRLRSTQSLVFTRLVAGVFGGTTIKILLQFLSGIGIVLLIVDMIFFAVDLRTGTFIPYMLMLAVALFRGSMALGYCIIRILAFIRGGELGGLGGKVWAPFNIRIFFEVAGFALSFLSLSNGLSRIDYKLVSDSSGCVVKTLIK